MTDDLETLRKRLFYRAHHRGTKEMDLVFGAFAEAHLEDFCENELKRFEAVLQISDADFTAWIIGQAPVPAIADAELVGEIVAFARSGIDR